MSNIVEFKKKENNETLLKDLIEGRVEVPEPNYLIQNALDHFIEFKDHGYGWPDELYDDLLSVVEELKMKIEIDQLTGDDSLSFNKGFKVRAKGKLFTLANNALSEWLAQFPEINNIRAARLLRQFLTSF